ncbi:hypothetical protein ADUPG1_000019 [Aduncisulcus paluster]|uniref:C2H2-type domain-containing protein n=1 Tax=Aduncisulcus paluster TaxID=2918883 RepID=A0ABQ5K698_9EUKA|nr:hypothetical protein ADUPG1_000019 [Aduncisulcus paluster]
MCTGVCAIICGVFFVLFAVGVVLGVICSIFAVICALFMACGCCMRSAANKLEDAMMDMDTALLWGGSPTPIPIPTPTPTPMLDPNHPILRFVLCVPCLWNLRKEICSEFSRYDHDTPSHSFLHSKKLKIISKKKGTSISHINGAEVHVFPNVLNFGHVPYHSKTKKEIWILAVESSHEKQSRNPISTPTSSRSPKSPKYSSSSPISRKKSPNIQPDILLESPTNIYSMSIVHALSESSEVPSPLLDISKCRMESPSPFSPGSARKSPRMVGHRTKYHCIVDVEPHPYLSFSVSSYPYSTSLVVSIEPHKQREDDLRKWQEDIQRKIAEESQIPSYKDIHVVQEQSNPVKPSKNYRTSRSETHLIRPYPLKLSKSHSEASVGHFSSSVGAGAGFPLRARLELAKNSYKHTCVNIKISVFQEIDTYDTAAKKALDKDPFLASTYLSPQSGQPISNSGNAASPSPVSPSSSPSSSSSSSSHSSSTSTRTSSPSYVGCVNLSIPIYIDINFSSSPSSRALLDIAERRRVIIEETEKKRERDEDKEIARRNILERKRLLAVEHGADLALSQIHRSPDSLSPSTRANVYSSPYSPSYLSMEAQQHATLSAMLQTDLSEEEEELEEIDVDRPLFRGEVEHIETRIHAERRRSMRITEELEFISAERRAREIVSPPICHSIVSAVKVDDGVSLGSPWNDSTVVQDVGTISGSSPLSKHTASIPDPDTLHSQDSRSSLSLTRSHSQGIGLSSTFKDNPLFCPKEKPQPLDDESFDALFSEYYDDCSELEYDSCLRWEFDKYRENRYQFVNKYSFYVRRQQEHAKFLKKMRKKAKITSKRIEDGSEIPCEMNIDCYSDYAIRGDEDDFISFKKHFTRKIILPFLAYWKLWEIRLVEDCVNLNLGRRSLYFDTSERLWKEKVEKCSKSVKLIRNSLSASSDPSTPYFGEGLWCVQPHDTDSGSDLGEDYEGEDIMCISEKCLKLLRIQCELDADLEESEEIRSSDDESCWPVIIDKELQEAIIDVGEFTKISKTTVYDRSHQIALMALEQTRQTAMKGCYSIILDKTTSRGKEVLAVLIHTKCGTFAVGWLDVRKYKDEEFTEAFERELRKSYRAEIESSQRANPERAKSSSLRHHDTNIQFIITHITRTLGCCSAQIHKVLEAPADSLTTHLEELFEEIGIEKSHVITIWSDREPLMVNVCRQLVTNGAGHS